MKIREIENAADEAKRFLDKVEEFYKREKEVGNMITIVGFKETGALRRASLDLTRSIANMRQS